MLPIVLCALAVTGHAMVADIATMQRIKNHEIPLAVEVDSAATVQQLEDVVLLQNSTNCSTCCFDEFTTLWPKWQKETDTSMTTKNYAGFTAFNTAREAAFATCGATTSEKSLYLREIELFLAWGIIITRMSAGEFCHYACAAPVPGLPHKSRTAFAANMALVGQELRKAEQKLMENQAMIVSALTAQEGNTTSSIDSELATACSSGCFKGSIYIGNFMGQALFGGQGTFCATATTASLNVCKTQWPQATYKGTCKGMTITPKKAAYTKFETITFSGGSGKCKARDTISKVVCQPGNTWTAFLKNDMAVAVESGSKCLIEEFAHNMAMSIDEALDHNEHGEHANDLLVDCYKHALRQGVSLVEKSRQEFSHLEHQLEARHETRAKALHAMLPEEDQKHHMLPLGTSILFG